MLQAGLLRREPFYCSECGRPIEAGSNALCADGYQRVYGEYVLSDEDDDEHEYNWPETHVDCLPKGEAGYGS